MRGYYIASCFFALKTLYFMKGDNGMAFIMVCEVIIAFMAALWFWDNCMPTIKKCVKKLISYFNER